MTRSPLSSATRWAHDAAVAGIANHLNKFWEPRMRRQFLEIVESGGAGLNPLAVAAAAKVRKPRNTACSFGK
ncbi:formate dehydrogenase subunit delta [Allomesorhizobium camelthorni]|uniref:Formate dehydrogenase subunit delta n=1 Tax=Allomesorhizobium camelthorni TaxID=475069 RepID=A0A6G4W7L3_9HYPH|nr:formate dehydrogenase subunit delta [Mesorhizobium camelthorni]NGO50544.1 formate dehydrogenase subunit delta [Mesorhizobium camelthorni]